MKENILNTAKDLFLKLGYKSVTMDDISNEMGISKKTLYKYFKNKETLVRETVTLINSECLQKINKVKKENYSVIRENFEIEKQSSDFFVNVGKSPIYQLKKYYPKIYKEMMKNEVNMFKDIVKNNIKKGISEGSYRKDIDIDVCTDFYFSLIFEINERDIGKEELLKLERQALIYHTRAIATEKGIKELETELDKHK